MEELQTPDLGQEMRQRDQPAPAIGVAKPDSQLEELNTRAHPACRSGKNWKDQGRVPGQPFARDSHASQCHPRLVGAS